jgi:hypothetical protein
MVIFRNTIVILFPERMSSPPVFSGVRVARFLCSVL